MANQQQDDMNRLPNWVPYQSMAYEGHPQNSLGIQSGLPSGAGNENEETHYYPFVSDQRHDIGDVQINTAQEFITTPYPPLEYRKFTVTKTISSAEWVSANSLLLHDMEQHDRQDVDFQAAIGHRISPNLWPIIPLEIRPLAYAWLTESQKDTLDRASPLEFQARMTTVEEHIIPPHPEEVYFRALERDISNLPNAYAHSGALMKLELQNMFNRHLQYMGKNEKAGRWLQQQIDQTRHSTLATWINSWSGRDNGLRPPINNADGLESGRNTQN